MGLRVTAVCSAGNGAQARSLGAERVIDYAVEDFAAGSTVHDLVIDLVGNRSLRDLRRSVAPAGAVVLSGGGVPGERRFVGPIGLLVRAQLSKSRRGPSLSTPLASPRRKDLEELADLVDRSVIAPVIDRRFSFDDAAAAFRYMENDHARGKVGVSRAI